jgi:SAM-dependent methyltransferase
MWTKSAKLKEHFDAIASLRPKFKSRARYYYKSLENLMGFIIPRGKRVIEIGCGTGELLAAMEPSDGVGVDISGKMLDIARHKFPPLRFVEADAHQLDVDGTFDYVIMSDLVGNLEDVQLCFEQLHKITEPRSRVIVTHYNKLWYPVVSLAEWLGVKSSAGIQNWLSIGDLAGIMNLAGFEVVTSGRRFLCPYDIPLVGWFCNRILANLPLFNRLCLVQYIVARPKPVGSRGSKEYSVSVIVPTLNEAGNMEGAVTRVPDMGSHVEMIFIDGHSTDGTVEKIHELMKLYPQRDIKFAYQSGKGKADAVFKGFDMATGEVLMILDSDLTAPPEDLPKFYDAIASGTGEFVNGCRLIYPMEDEAMRTLNYFANHTFGMIFTWLLGQRIKDTLCGTKVLLRKDYEQIKKNRKFFGDFDPFGDFDLLFGAAKLNMKIVDIPVRYRNRVYGDIKIARFRHGLLLLRMCVFAARKIKFI